MAQLEAGANIAAIDSNGSLQTEQFDANGNPVVRADGATIGATAQSGMPLLVKHDEQLYLARGDRSGSVGTAAHTLMWHEPFDSATINATRWTAAQTTFVPAQTTNGYNFNSTAVTTANAVATLISSRYFAKIQGVPLRHKFRFRATNYANTQIEEGFGIPSGTTLIGNGAFIRIVGTTLTGVLTTAGAEVATTTNIDITTSIGTSNYYSADIIVDDDSARFVVVNTQTGVTILDEELALPVSQIRMWAVSHLPIFARLYNGAIAPSTAPVFIVSDMVVTALDWNQNDPAAVQLAANSYGSYALPTTGATNITWTNSAAPASATLSNTAAGYGTLGGLYQFAAVAGAATDYALFALAVPTGNQLVIDGVDIEAWNTGAAVATTPTLMVWGLAVQSTAVSLATATYLRQGLGAQSFPVGAAVGAKAERISVNFSTPMVCDSGKFVAVILRMPVGTATASQVVQGMVAVRGHYR